MPDAYEFNATEYTPAAPRGTTIPDGWYRAWITDSETKKTTAGTGKYIELTWQVLDGPHAKWHIWDRLNVENPSKTAQDIAREALSAICHAVGVMRMTNTGQLHGKPCLIKVITKRQKGYSDKNEIRGYLPDGADTSKYGGGASKLDSAPTNAALGGTLAPALTKSDDDSDLPF